MRTRRETVVFQRPFRLPGIDHLVPAGAYTLVTDEETIEGLSFSVFRRLATMITVPAGPHSSAMETISINPLDLADAQRADSLPTDAGSKAVLQSLR
jgi:hypothetical protein